MKVSIGTVRINFDNEYVQVKLKDGSLIHFAVMQGTIKQGDRLALLVETMPDASLHYSIVPVLTSLLNN